MPNHDRQVEDRSPPAKMAVAVVNHNTREKLRACLASVAGEAAGEVVVVDNASHDGSAAMVRSAYPWVLLHENTVNRGYGAAANQAIESCQAQYILLLNSDTCLQAGALNALFSYLDLHPRAAIAGPRLVNPDGSLQASCYPFPTPLHVFLEESALGRRIQRVPILRDRYLRTWSHAYSRHIPWVLGAALAIRRQAFTAVGGFDESFFLYGEEIDLCYRLRAAGWQTHFTPLATVVHDGGASTQQRRADFAVQFFLSMAQFYDHHYPAFYKAQFTLIVKSIVLARLLRDTLRLRLVSGQRERAVLAEDVTAWRRILLLGGLRRELAESRSTNR